MVYICPRLADVGDGVMRNKMLNIKTKFDTFQIPDKEEFSKRTEVRFTRSNFLIQLFLSPLFRQQLDL